MADVHRKASRRPLKRVHTDRLYLGLLRLLEAHKAFAADSTVNVGEEVGNAECVIDLYRKLIGATHGHA